MFERVIVSEPIEGGAPTEMAPLQLGGTRHNSAAQFAQDQPDALALVASQDGRFTAFAWSAREGAVHAHRVEALAGPVLEVHCSCPAELARERYRSRSRHPCHFDLSYGVDMFDQWIRTDAGPLDLGGPLLEVDTTEAIAVDDIVSWVRAAV